jgi:hypothetical protein
VWLLLFGIATNVAFKLAQISDGSSGVERGFHQALKIAPSRSTAVTLAARSGVLSSLPKSPSACA